MPAILFLFYSDKTSFPPDQRLFFAAAGSSTAFTEKRFSSMAKILLKISLVSVTFIIRFFLPLPFLSHILYISRTNCYTKFTLFFHYFTVILPPARSPAANGAR